MMLAMRIRVSAYLPIIYHYYLFLSLLLLTRSSYPTTTNICNVLFLFAPYNTNIGDRVGVDLMYPISNACGQLGQSYQVSVILVSFEWANCRYVELYPGLLDRSTLLC